MDRPSRTEWFMQMAHVAARRGTCPRKKVGAVIVQQNHLVGIGYNGAPPGMPHCEHDPSSDEPCLNAIHAEVNALAFSARHGVRTEGASMYCTCSTCVPCAQLLISAGIEYFIYDEEYRLKDGLDLLQEARVTTMQFPRRSFG